MSLGFTRRKASITTSRLISAFSRGARLRTGGYFTDPATAQVRRDSIRLLATAVRSRASTSLPPVQLGYQPAPIYAVPFPPGSP